MLQSLPVWGYDTKTKKTRTLTLQQLADDSMQTVIKYLTHKEIEIKGIKESIEKADSEEEKNTLREKLWYSISFGGYYEDPEDKEKWFFPRDQHMNQNSGVSLEYMHVSKMIKENGLDYVVENHIKPYFELFVIIEGLRFLSRKFIPLSTGSQQIGLEAQAMLAEYCTEWVTEKQEYYGEEK
jgi:hypothetical protein